MSEITLSPISGEPTQTPPGFKVTTGTKVVLSFRPPIWNHLVSPSVNNSSYFKSGIRHEVYEWLNNNVGEYCRSYYRWEEGQGDWTYCGTNPKGSNPLADRSLFDRDWLVTLWFRDPKKALLFKLTWAGRL